MKAILFVIAWLWVAVPLSWGVWKSVEKSMPLFKQGASKNTPEAPK